MLSMLDVLVRDQSEQDNSESEANDYTDDDMMEEQGLLAR